MKRNKQQKYRIKTIQELHLNKKQQKELDDHVNTGILTYKEIYILRHDPKLLYAISKFRKAGKEINKIKYITCNSLYGIFSIFNRLANSLRGI